MSTQCSEIEVRYMVDPPIEVLGSGAWSNTGRPRRYIVEAAVATIRNDRLASIWWRGRSSTGRALSSPFLSRDPALAPTRWAIQMDLARRALIPAPAREAKR